MASLQALVNNLLVWQSSCTSKLRPLKTANIFVQPLVDVQLIIRNMDKRLARETKTGLRFSYYYYYYYLIYPIAKERVVPKGMNACTRALPVELV